MTDDSAKPAPPSGPPIGPKPANPNHWTYKLARSKWGLGLLSFAESTVVPIPLEAIVGPLMLGHYTQALRIALIIFIGFLFGATAFYFVGLWLAEPVVLPILDWLGLRDSLEQFTAEISQSGVFWTIFLISFSPVPTQLATLGAGVVGANFWVFFVAIATSRALRYFGMALLSQLAGPRIAALRIAPGKLAAGLILGLGAVWIVMQIIPG